MRGRDEVSATHVTATTFIEVYEAHAATVLRSLRRLGIREADLEDIAQEVFVIVHRKLAEFEGRSSLKTWLFGICVRVASDYRQRAHVKRETGIDEAPERTTSGETPTRQIAMKQARLKLEALLERLDEDKRSVFVLFELEELPMAEVASAVGVPLQTAYARLYAARRFIEGEVTRRQEVSA
jgi:RNA polymerase sigma-70 factor, ECF subfamily